MNVVTAGGPRSSVRYALARAVDRGAGSAPNYARHARLFRYYAENSDSPIRNGANVITSARKFMQYARVVGLQRRKVAGGTADCRMDCVRHRKFAVFKPPTVAGWRFVAALGVDSRDGVADLCVAHFGLAGGAKRSREDASSNAGRERCAGGVLRDCAVLGVG